MTGETYPGGWACVIPVKMATEAINAHPDILAGYTLKYEYVDNEVCFFCLTFDLLTLLNCTVLCIVTQLRYSMTYAGKGPLVERTFALVSLSS